MNMKIRPGPGSNAWGATLPIELVPETTVDDDFEEQAVDWLKLYHFPDGGFHTLRGRAWPVRMGRSKHYLRPDIVTLVLNTERVVFVGDAKRHKRLDRRSVDKIVTYKRATKAEKAAVFVPRACRISPKVNAHAQRHRIEIVTL